MGEKGRVTENEENRKNKTSEKPGDSVNTEAEEVYEKEVMIGACRFCGQIAQVENGTNQEEWNREATLQCDCWDAKELRKKIRQAEKAKDNIRFLFKREYPETAGLLEAAVPILQEYGMINMSIDTGRGMKAKIAMTTKGKIRVEAVATKKRPEKVDYVMFHRKVPYITQQHRGGSAAPERRPGMRKKKPRSILQTQKGICYLCLRQGVTEEHHIFGGPNRQLSEQFRLKADLCVDCHRTGKKAVHTCKETMDKLHQDGQRAFEWYWGSREEFMKIFGKNYL